MSTSTQGLVLTQRRSRLLARAADYVELTKPRIAVLVLVTVAISGLSARWTQPDPWLLIHAMIGTLLVAASASALNHLVERRKDILMERTRQRPLPAGRLTSREVVLFSAVTIIAGAVYLFAMTGLLSALFGLATWVVYVWIYTPLKTRTSLNTAVGAVSGALPVLIGWTAVGGTLDLRAATLFLIVFLWQFPHFMAIAWMYRKDYELAGMKMLTVVDPTGRSAGIQAVACALVLLPVSFVPVLHGSAGSIYLIGAFLLGAGQLACSLAFLLRLDQVSARRLLHASLIYLPAILLLIVLIPIF